MNDITTSILVFFSIGSMLFYRGYSRSLSLMGTLLILTIAIFLRHSSYEALIFLSGLIPLVIVANGIRNIPLPKIKSTIQEKAFTYLSVLPFFGFYLIKREEMDWNAIFRSFQTSPVWLVEVFIIILTVLALLLTIKERIKK